METLEKLNLVDCSNIGLEIAVSSSQQAEAIGEISSNITQVADMPEMNVGVVQQTTKLIGDLGPMVLRVKDAVEQYHV